MWHCSNVAPKAKKSAWPPWKSYKCLQIKRMDKWSEVWLLNSFAKSIDSHRILDGRWKVRWTKIQKIARSSPTAQGSILLMMTTSIKNDWLWAHFIWFPSLYTIFCHLTQIYPVHWHLTLEISLFYDKPLIYVSLCKYNIKWTWKLHYLKRQFLVT